MLPPDYSRAAMFYLFVLVSSGLACTALALSALFQLDAAACVVVALGMSAALFGSAFPIRIPGTQMSYSLAGAVVLFILLSAGPWPAVLVATVAGATSAWRSPPRWTTRLALPASTAVATGAVGHMWHFAYDWVVAVGVPADAAVIWLAVGAGLLLATMSSAGVAVLIALERRKSFSLIKAVGHSIWSVLATSLMAALLYLAARQAAAQVIAATGLVAAGMLIGIHRQARRHALLATREKAVADELYRMAGQDPLTGLPNRRAFQDAVKAALQRTRSCPDRRLALMYLDFDRFKHINDSLGHRAGDELLVAASHRMQQQLRSSDVVARLGGDEFAVLIDCLDGEEHACTLATRLLNALGQPYEIAGQQVTSRASIGMTFAGGADPRCCDELLHDADTAMFDAKSAGRGCYRVFASSDHSGVVAG